MDREYRRQNAWNFIFSVFFVGALVSAVLWLQYYRTLPQSVSAFDVLLMALATFRITRLVVYDKIARWFRDLFRGTSGFATTVQDLLQCPWCIGVWAALIVAFSYYAFEWAWFVVLFLALAGAGSLLQVVANGIGWRAETLKLEAKEKGNL